MQYKTAIKMKLIYKITKTFKEIYILAAFPQDIEITEKGTPQHNRVKIMVVLNNIHHIHYNNNNKMVKQVVTMILIFL